MLAVRLHALGSALSVEQVPIPEPRARQVRIRVAGCGVCHTDLRIVRGEVPRVSLPLTLGHEVSGCVDAWGPDAVPDLEAAGLHAGDPVLVFGGWGCGECPQCVSGREQRCRTGRSPGFQVDGGYAEALLVPEAQHLVSLGALDPVHAAPLADAGLTPYRAVRRAAPWLRPGARVEIIGFGGLGQFAIQYLRRNPDLRISVLDLNPEKVALAAAMGADEAIAPEHTVTLESGGVDSGSEETDVIFDFVGSDVTLAAAARQLAPGGLLMVVGEAAGTISFGFEVAPLESWVTTTAWGSIGELREVVELAAAGALTWDVEVAPLEEAAIAHARLAGGEVRGRVVLVPPVT